MRALLSLLLVLMSLTFTAYAGGEGGSGTGGGPSIILRTLNDVDIRIITDGHWELDDFNEDILVIEGSGKSIYDYKFEVVAPDETKIKFKLIELIDRGDLEVTIRNNLISW